jgi:mycothiol system anti-sigma-R factor
VNARVRVSACRGLSVAVETYLDGELDPSQIVEVESHLAECPTCREHVALHRATRTSLRAAVKMTAPESLRDRLRARMAEERERTTPVPAPVVQTPPAEITPAPFAAPRSPDRSRPMRARYAVPFAFAAAAAFAIAVRTPPSQAPSAAVAEAPRTPASLYYPVSEAGIGLDGILDDLVAQHASPLPSEVSRPEDVRTFDTFVGVPVEPPKFSPFGARWEGARILPIRDSRAAMMQYSMAGGHRVTVYVYDPSRLRGESRHLRPQLVRSTPVLVGKVRGFNVAATERRGVGYALATDLGERESVELAMAGQPLD